MSTPSSNSESSLPAEFALAELPDIVLLTDQQGQIVYANAQVERLGYTPLELQGVLLDQLDTSLFTPDRYASWWNSNNATWQYHETSLRARNGQSWHTEVRSRRISYRGQDLLYSICRDLNKEQSLFHRGLSEVALVARHIHEVLWITSADRRQLVYVSPAYDELFGQSRDELFEDFGSFMRMFHPEDAERAANDLSRTPIEDHVGEYRFLRKGEVRWVRIRAIAVRNEAGEITSYCGISEDVTERKRHEEAIRRQGERQAALARFSRMAIFETRLDYLMRELTESVCRTLGGMFSMICEADMETRALHVRAMWSNTGGHIPQEQFDRLNISSPDLLTVHALTTGEPAYANKLKTHSDVNFPFLAWLGMRSAISVPVRLEDHVFGTLGAAFDTPREFSAEEINFLESVGSVLAGAIQRQHTLTQLSDSELKFRTLYETTPDVILVVNKLGEIEMSNRAGLEQRPDETLVGSSSFECVHPDYQPRYREALERCFQQGTPDDFEHLGADDSWWHARICPLEIGGKRRALIISANINPRKQAELNLQKDRELLRQLLEHHERERQLIAYEIHDGMVQHMTGALMHLEAFNHTLSQTQPRDQATLDLVMKLLRESINEARRLIGGLRPPILDESGIVAAIEYLISELTESSGIDVEFQHRIPAARMHSTLESTIFRIVQEALNNAVRHGKAQTAQVTLRTDEQWLYLTVADTGVGFDPEQVPTSRFGLRGIADRARLIGGSVQVTSSPGSGARIDVRLPLIDPLAN